MDIEQVREATTPAEMRSEIARLARQEVMVRRVMDASDYTGLSSEDRYTMLAYYSLQECQRYKKAVYEHLVSTPGPHLQFFKTTSA